jgi:Protein of unknown function (DUF3551)
MSWETAAQWRTHAGICERKLAVRREAGMRRTCCVLAIVAAMCAICGSAEAQNYPWCADYSPDNGENCGFSTYQQCMQNVAGIGGSCERNTQYRPSVAHPNRGSVPRRHSRHERTHR